MLNWVNDKLLYFCMGSHHGRHASHKRLIVFLVVSDVYPFCSVPCLSHQADCLPRRVQCLPLLFCPMPLPPCLSSSLLCSKSTTSILSHASPTRLIVFLVVSDVYPFYSVPCFSHQAYCLPRRVRCLPLLFCPMPLPPGLLSSSSCPMSTPSILSNASSTRHIVFLVVSDVYPFYSVPCLSHQADCLPRRVRCIPLLCCPMPLPPGLLSSSSSSCPMSIHSILSNASPTRLIVFLVVSDVYPFYSVPCLSHQAYCLPRRVRCLPLLFCPMPLPPGLLYSTSCPMSTPSILSHASPTRLIVFLVVSDVYPYYSVPCLSHQAYCLPRRVRCLPLLFCPMPLPPGLLSSSSCPMSTPCIPSHASLTMLVFFLVLPNCPDCVECKRNMIECRTRPSIFFS